MISLFNVFIAILWFFSALIDYSGFCYIWQLKEYRLDRMRDFMSTQQGRSFWKGYTLFWRSVIAIIIFFWPINSALTTKYFLIGIFGFEFIRNIYQAYYKKLRYPILTKKALFIVLASVVIEGVLFILTRDWELLLLMMILRFFIISLIIVALIFPTLWFKKYYIKKAAQKISRHKNLIIIGITGSYGKTTVKTFLSHILSKKFRVIKTPKNINTEIGVANFILKNNFNNFNVFVVEMGAYRMGEIQMICDMVRPKIGVLTAISEQHLSLFGNIKQTQKAKYELLRSLPKDGLAVLNNDNFYCREHKNDLQCEVMTFGIDAGYSPDCIINEVVGSKDGIICSGTINNEEWKVQAPVLGTHNALNIAPCLLVGKYLGISLEEMKEQCKTLASPDRTTKIYSYGKSKIIDDSYNANYNGFCAALDVLGTFPSNMTRVVI